MILVTGATGNVGREVVNLLRTLQVVFVSVAGAGENSHPAGVYTRSSWVVAQPTAARG